MRSFFKASFFTLIRFFLVSVLSFVQLPILIGVYGAEGLGYWALYQSLTVVGVVSLLEFGLSASLTRSYSLLSKSRKISLIHSDFSIANTIYIFLSFALFVIYLVALQFAEKLNDVYLFIIFFLVLQFPAFNLRALLSSQLYFSWIAVWDLSRSVLIFLFVIFLAFWEEMEIEYLFLFDSFVSFLIYCFFYRLSLSKGLHSSGFSSVSKDFFIRHTEISGIGFFNRLIGIVHQYGPHYFAFIFIGPAGAGYLSAFRRLPSFLKQVQGAVNSVVLPFVARLDRGKKQEETMYVLTKISYSVFSVLFLFFIIFVKEILLLWLGEESSEYFFCVAVLLTMQTLICPFLPILSGLYDKRYLFLSAIFSFVSVVFLGLSLAYIENDVAFVMYVIALSQLPLFFSGVYFFRQIARIRFGKLIVESLFYIVLPSFALFVSVFYEALYVKFAFYILLIILVVIFQYFSLNNQMKNELKGYINSRFL
ncbi:polysaccharide biosynthesis protein [Marinomonas mediterranea MMB-1]|uniref:Polysaccharide biosynthesis protein n=1 Tax=Marinomonas mediterranea (strain ATCC 700492 / JCM 21426 / NBRC 103028 / MMB-1) TaxID=717774 RepID=F2K165_MARM1|nr:polysaccharide biosynthesis protein [Marinomonas mediterranea MMB-1]